MAYTFDPTSGETRASLASRVTLNSFSETRYAEVAKRALNDAVTTICRRLNQIEAHEVLSYDANGVVADSALPWFRILEVWAGSATAPAVGEKAFATAANYALQPLPDHYLGAMYVGAGPLFYIARRRTSPTGFAPQLDLRIVPPGAAGFVAVKGLQRPAVMATDAAVTGLGADLDRAIVAYAKAQCFENEDDFDAADRWMQRYEIALREAIEGGTSDDQPMVVNGTWDS